MSSSEESTDDVFLNIPKSVAVNFIDQTSKDSGIGDDDSEGCKCLSQAFDCQTVHSKNHCKISELTFRPFRSLSVDSPVDDYSLPLTDIASPLPKDTDVLSRRIRKRQSPTREENEITPVIKRRRGIDRLRRFNSLDLPEGTCTGPSMLSCDKKTENHIKLTLDRVSSDTNLISDGSKSYSLPTIPGKHQDLKSIRPETLAKVVNNEYDDVIGSYMVVDCRYPYEFEGGHIKGAKNYFPKDLIMEHLIEKQVQSENPKKRNVIIFHCEFSSERGPKLSRFLRSMDRERNADSYPFLFYPEIYILHGGYKEFFVTQKNLCFPQTYAPVLLDGYKADLKKFKVKSKSWGGEKQSSKLRRGLKF